MSRTSPLLQRWQQLAERDRSALLLLIIALLLSAGYLGLWQPLQHQLGSARAQFQEQRTLLEYLTANALRAKQGALSQQASIAAAQLQTVATQSAAEAGLRIERYEQNGDTLSLSFNQVAYPALLRWLGRLQAQGVQVQDINLSRNASDNELLANLSLSVAGS